VSPAREQAEEGRLDGLGCQVERGDVALEVVDRNERKPTGPRNRLRRGEPDEQRAYEPRPLRDRDALDVAEQRLRIVECLADDRRHELQVAPRGDLRHDATVPRVQRRLRGDD
jgi:hypothetical protein